MSAPPGRSPTVSGLSGRVHALKFMQRASPASTPTKQQQQPLHHQPSASNSPGASATASPSASPSLRPVGDAQEEQWSLSPAAIAKLRAKAQAKTDKNQAEARVSIQQHAGFDAWLIEREKHDEHSRRPNHRQTFGKLAKNADHVDQQGAEDSSTIKRDRASEDDDDDDDDEEEQSVSGSASDNDSSNNTGASRRFIKPGSAKDGSSRSSAKKAKKHGKKDQDKVVFARKRGGKHGISGGRR